MTGTQTLLDGYKRFYKKHFLQDSTLYHELATQGQSPKTLVIACSDSRVDPAIITDADPGDIFVVRNVANLVPPFQKAGDSLHGTSAALEFAVRHLQVQHIIILGHTACAGIHALLHTEAEQDDFSFMYPWVNIAKRAKNYTLNLLGEAEHPEAQHVCEQQGILVSLQNLMTFPWIASKVESGELTLHGWYFRLTTGQLCVWDSVESRFVIAPTE